MGLVAIELRTRVYWKSSNALSLKQLDANVSFINKDGIVTNDEYNQSRGRGEKTEKNKPGRAPETPVATKEVQC